MLHKDLILPLFRIFSKIDKETCRTCRFITKDEVIKHNWINHNYNICNITSPGKYLSSNIDCVININRENVSIDGKDFSLNTKINITDGIKEMKNDQIK